MTPQDRRAYQHEQYLKRRQLQPEWRRCEYCGTAIRSSGRRRYCDPNHRKAAFRERHKNQEGKK